MNPIALRQPSLAALAMLLGACASAPEHLYTLELAAPTSAAPRAGRPLVVIESVSLPELVDRPQLVVRAGKYSVAVREQERWAVPLNEMLPPVIASELASRCPAAEFRSMPIPPSTAVHARLSISFGTFEIDEATGVSLVASWTYRDGKAADTAGVAEGHAEISKKDSYSDVDGVQRALDPWANDLAQQLAVCR